MDNDGERLIYLAIGPLIALVLAIALTPLRGLTSASNLTFFFLILTIVVAEYGGRWAAVATALISALSLDFFLTQPYHRLAIEDKNDVLAFIGLAVCGLVAAALGSDRAARTSARRTTRQLQALIDTALAELVSAGAVDIRAAELMNACLTALPLSAVVLRDAANEVVAAKPIERPVPAVDLDLGVQSLSNWADRSASQGAVPLPADGARLVLSAGGRAVGWLDVWGSRATASAESRRALANVAQVAAALLATRSRQ